MEKPNERHERFCREYVRRPLGSAAAQACRLQARPEIQLRIAALRDEGAARQCRDANAVLGDIAGMAGTAGLPGSLPFPLPPADAARSGNRVADQ